MAQRIEIPPDIQRLHQSYRDLYVTLVRVQLAFRPLVQAEHHAAEFVKRASEDRPNVREVT